MSDDSTTFEDIAAHAVIEVPGAFLAGIVEERSELLRDVADALLLFSVAREALAGIPCDNGHETALVLPDGSLQCYCPRCRVDVVLGGAPAAIDNWLPQGDHVMKSYRKPAGEPEGGAAPLGPTAEEQG